MFNSKNTKPDLPQNSLIQPTTIDLNVLFVFFRTPCKIVENKQTTNNLLMNRNNTIAYISTTSNCPMSQKIAANNFAA